MPESSSPTNNKIPFLLRVPVCWIGHLLTRVVVRCGYTLARSIEIEETSRQSHNFKLSTFTLVVLLKYIS